MDSEQVIVYRSKWEAEMDQFFFDNPEYILYFAGGCVLLVILIVAVDKLKKSMGIRR
jgi:hypothetical protein